MIYVYHDLRSGMQPFMVVASEAIDYCYVIVIMTQRDVEGNLLPLCDCHHCLVKWAIHYS